MSRYDTMIAYIPLYCRESKIFRAILSVEGQELDLLRDTVNTIKSQFFVDNATWGLDYREKEFGLPIDNEITYEDRRSRLKGKMRGIGKVDADLIKSVTQAYSDGETDIGFDGKIHVTFVGTRGIPTDLQALKTQVSDIIPAHLEVEYHFTYLTWSEFNILTAQAQESMTWAQLEVYKPFSDPSDHLVWDEFDLIIPDVQEGMTWDEIEMFKQD